MKSILVACVMMALVLGCGAGPAGQSGATAPQLKPLAPGKAANEFYIDGAVARRGVYSLKTSSGRPVTVSQAIEAAGGLAANADPAQVVVLRMTGPETQESIAVNLDKIARQEAPDLALQDQDLVKVPFKAAPAPPAPGK